ncbi:hypothetical protein [Frankia sp. AgB32]|uniref:hypothetical protein n=1 Tax=Frankia sp. AgB32 TaxID=631119 RepID=UPI00200FAC09|nr:hypothetical protein [Frankia sp. AgB32]MCK9896607.1 hypothetical protein [Frankia sp. AgB32]
MEIGEARAVELLGQGEDEGRTHCAADRDAGSGAETVEGTAVVTVDRVPLALWMLRNFAVDPWRDLL